MLKTYWSILSGSELIIFLPMRFIWSSILLYRQTNNTDRVFLVLNSTTDQWTVPRFYTNCPEDICEFIARHMQLSLEDFELMSVRYNAGDSHRRLIARLHNQSVLPVDLTGDCQKWFASSEIKGLSEVGRIKPIVTELLRSVEQLPNPEDYSSDLCQPAITTSRMSWLTQLLQNCLPRRLREDLA